TINAGASDKVNLRGLLLDGAASGNAGILFTGGASLNVQDCLIRNFVNDGIDFQPGASSMLSVSRTVVADNSNGLVIAPSGSASATAALARTGVTKNANAGLIAAAAQGAVAVTLAESVIAGNGTGIFGDSGAGPTAVTVRGSTISGNA